MVPPTVHHPEDAATTWGLLAPVRWLVLALAGVLGIIIAAVWLAHVVAIAVVLSVAASVVIFLFRRARSAVAAAASAHLRRH